MSGTKRSADASPDSKDTPKRMRVMEPDVTILVGPAETKFHHYSLLLCNTSEYFDAMFSSEMKETQTKVVEFKGKDPKEWKELSVFFDDPLMAEVNSENVDMLVPLFSELRMMGALNCVDKFLKVEMLKIKAEFEETMSGSWRTHSRNITFDTKTDQTMRLVSRIVIHLKMSIDNQLALSTEEGLLFLADILVKFPDLLLHESSIGTVASFFNDEVAKNHLWPILKTDLPESCQSIGKDSLSGSALLEAVIQLKAKLSQAELVAERKSSNRSYR